MKSAGIIGGIAPASTIEYYRQIIDSYRKRTGQAGYPSIVVNSIDLTKMFGFIDRGQLDSLTDYLLAEIERLALARVDFGLFASNTPHLVFDEIRRRAPIPMISIVEAACEAAEARHLRRLGLLGTRSTMSGAFYPDVFSRAGLAIVVPGKEEQELVHEKYMSELVNGIFLDETRKKLLAVVGRMIEAEAIDGLILGGTELPFVLRDEGEAGIPFLDTTRLHVERVVAELIS